MNPEELREVARKVIKQREAKYVELAAPFTEALYTQMRKAAEDGQYEFNIDTTNIHQIIPDAPHPSAIWGGYTADEAYNRTGDILNGMAILLRRNGYVASAASPNLTLGVTWD